MNRDETMTDRTVGNPSDLDALSFWENGLLPVVAQDSETGEVLMVAFANREALEQTLGTGQMHYWSRSRQELWHKGATSGNFQALVSIHADCDGDTLLARVRPMGPACHTEEQTCFGDLRTDLLQPFGDDEPAGSRGTETPLHDPAPGETRPPEAILPRIWSILQARDQARPPESYTVRLLEDENLRLKKLGEETAELILALSRGEGERIAEEGADLVYHLLVALLASGVDLEDLLSELGDRIR